MEFWQIVTSSKLAILEASGMGCQLGVVEGCQLGKSTFLLYKNIIKISMLLNMNIRQFRLLNYNK